MSRPSAVLGLCLALCSACSLASEGTGGVDEALDDSGATFSDSTSTLDDSTTPIDTGEEPDSAPLSETSAPDTSTPPPDTKPPPSDTTPPPDTAPPIDMGPVCSEATCGALPAGAKRIALADPGTACPPGFKGTDLVEIKEGDACTCNCTLTSPTCPGTGEMKTYYSSGSSCGTTGTSLYPGGSGTCTNLAGGGSLSNYFKATAPGPLGGGCPPSLKTDTSAVSRPRRVCEPLTGCAGDICKSPYVECVEGVACGGAFPNARTIVSALSATCPSCTCGFSPGTCSGSVTFYDNGSCSGTSVTLAVNNTCVAVGSSPSISSYKYTTSAVSGASCTPSYTTARGTLNPVAARNLCCR